MADWAPFLIPLVFMVIYVLNQLLAASNKNAQQQQQQQQRPNPRRNPGQPEASERPLRQPPGGAPAGGGQPVAQQAGQQGPEQSQLNAEIEQFLKRANDRRNERSRREPAKPIARPPATPPKVLREQPVDVEPIERRELGSIESKLANRHLEERAEHHVGHIAHANEEIEQHLKSVFSHHPERLADAAYDLANPAETAKLRAARAASLTADTIGALLSDPQRIQQAIILKEILQRPVDRW